MNEAFEKWWQDMREANDITGKDYAYFTKEWVKLAFAAGQASEREEGFHTTAKVVHYIHCGGVKMGRLPVIDYLPEDLIGKEVDVVIRVLV